MRHQRRNVEREILGGFHNGSVSKLHAAGNVEVHSARQTETLAFVFGEHSPVSRHTAKTQRHVQHVLVLDPGIAVRVDRLASRVLMPPLPAERAFLSRFRIRDLDDWQVGFRLVDDFQIASSIDDDLQTLSDHVLFQRAQLLAAVELERHLTLCQQVLVRVGHGHAGGCQLLDGKSPVTMVL